MSTLLVGGMSNSSKVLSTRERGCVLIGRLLTGYLLSSSIVGLILTKSALPSLIGVAVNSLNVSIMLIRDLFDSKQILPPKRNDLLCLSGYST